MNLKYLTKAGNGEQLPTFCNTPRVVAQRGHRASGRLPWEIPNRPAQNPQEESSPPAGRTPDPNGQIGAQLDLLG
ncbi:MAG TPA: hypothetical protein PLQ00_06540 [Thermoguttaceae bacterium]|nr:hypothetical protein [Thermoguttaceae bacterium]